ncbi:hypothetical protein P153DRAFT_334266 [Dothidotthia symphoricarpi CBS 119687]|uniref:Uncharacterized protein n=1 Tax=Dothidotthia symphoricarpi CBS 119687 TaxID=1392245 RepID=A0A6A6AK55_9PLEO|nr:uncharacterized protein P153DRAFT_334266 [Dothidotthia symphoricarpi CBS 119687]KAF2131936.1 hypothetical protein P153DRAFT_334266 [Dothidotthia symphoricarpi CBS 119687]
MSTDPSSFRSFSTVQPARSPRSSPRPQFQTQPQDELPAEQQPEEASDDDEIPYPEPSSEQTLLPPPNLRPFFTLIEDISSGEYYHPYVHYVFADDDPVMVTAASMRSLGLDDTKYLPQITPEGEDGQQVAEHDEPDSQVESPLPPPIPGVREHYLIVDVGADGRSIVDAKSLSSKWQTTVVSTRTTPSFDESEPDQGYMIRIEGVEVAGRSKGKDKGQPGDDKLSKAREQSQGDVFEALDSLVQGIEGGLEVAGNIAGKGLKESEEVGEADVAYDLEGTQ